jgi:hypothetical protein
VALLRPAGTQVAERQQLEEELQVFVVAVGPAQAFSQVME